MSGFRLFSIFFRGPQGTTQDGIPPGVLHLLYFLQTFFFRAFQGVYVFGITSCLPQLVCGGSELEPRCTWLQSLRTRMDARQQHMGGKRESKEKAGGRRKRKAKKQMSPLLKILLSVELANKESSLDN